MSTERDGYTTGLRHLADRLEADDDLTLPWQGHNGTPFLVFTTSKAQALAWVGALTHINSAEHKPDGSSWDFLVHGRLSGVDVLVYTRREHVAVRVVTGVEIAEQVEWLLTKRDDKPDPGEASTVHVDYALRGGMT